LVEDFHPKMSHHPLTRKLKQVDLKILKEESKDESHHIKKGHSHQSPDISSENVFVDGDLGQVGAHQVKERTDHEGPEAEEHKPEVGTDVLEQTDQKPQIVRFALKLVVRQS